MDPRVSDISTVLATPDQWRAWSAMRLRSLSEDPDAFGATHAAEARFGEDTWRARLDGTSGPAVLAYVCETAVGMGAGWLHEPGKLMVVAMWTDPAWRGRGVGRAVLGHVVGWAEERGHRVELWVADVNPAARRLYEGSGFRTDGRREPMREGSVATKTHLVL